MDVIVVGGYEFDAKLIDRVDDVVGNVCETILTENEDIPGILKMVYERGFARLALTDDSEDFQTKTFFDVTKGEYYDFIELNPYEFVVVSDLQKYYYHNPQEVLQQG